jgi:putative MATE family efflux protein
MPKQQLTLSLGEENINRLMLRFSIPCILSLLVSAFYNIVDQIFIGNSSLSTLGNAATGVVFPVFIIAQAFAWCLGDGCAAYLNICQGKNEADNAHRAIGASLTAAALSGFFIMAVVYPFRTPILTIFGASANTMAYSLEYLNVILLAMPIYILCNMMNSIIRADGSPSWAMAAMLAGAISNILFDPLFIFTLDMGMTGAALATVIGQGVSFIVSLVYLFRTKTFRLTRASFLPRIGALYAVTRLGVSTFITQLAIVVVTILCNVQLAKYGELSVYGADIPIAIIGIQSKLFTVVMNLVVGIVLGCQPIISFNMGAGKYDRVKELYRKIMIASLLIGLIFTAIFLCAPRFVVGLFGMPSNIPNPEDYWMFAEKTLRIFMMLISVSCLVKMNSIFFQAVGKPTYAIIASMIRDMVCFVPLILIMPLIRPDVEMILYASPLADFLALLVTAVLCVSFIRSLNRAMQ